MSVRLRSVLPISGTTLVALLSRIERVATPIPPIGVSLPFALRRMDSEIQGIRHNPALTSIGASISSTLPMMLVLPPLYDVSVRTGWIVRRVPGWGSGLARPRRLATGERRSGAHRPAPAAGALASGE